MALQLTTPENTITYQNAFCLSPQLLHKHCFSFSWGHFNSQEKLKTMLMQNFGVTNKEHYGMLWYFWSGQLVVHLSPRYNQVTVVSGNPFRQLQIDYSVDVHKDFHYQVKHRLYVTWTDTYIVSNARSLLKKQPIRARVLLYPYNKIR